MKILFLTNFLPFPLDNGGKIKSYTTLSALERRNHEVDLLCFRDSQNDSMCNAKEMISDCISYREVIQPITTVGNEKYMVMMAIKSILSSLPLCILKYKSSKMIREIEEKRYKDYNCIIYDHLPLFVYYSLCKKLWPKAKHILDEHNCETLLMKRNAKMESNFLKKAFMMYETIKLELFEKRSLLSASETVVLSVEDYNYLRDISKREFNYKIIPISVRDNGEKKYNNHGELLNILFVGTLTWMPNNQGLVWFLNNVIPAIEKEKLKYHFYIVGKNPSDEVVSKVIGNTNVTITGYVDSIDMYYDLCDCAVVPLFVGSGQRVKLIEAFSKGMPAVTTSIGAEGLECKDGYSVIIADSVEDFVEALKSLRNSDKRLRIGRNARKIYDDYYSMSIVEQKIMKIIES